MMDKVEEFINEEETLKAMKASRKLRRNPEERKRKEHIRLEDESKCLRERFNDFDFTPLNVGISEVLMEIKKDSEYQRPLRIMGTPPPQNWTYIVSSTRLMISAKFCIFDPLNFHPLIL